MAGLNRGLAATWQQHDLLLDSLDHRRTGRHVEQFSWLWRGPLDTERFTAAWQSVLDRETVLRAAFDWEVYPRVVLHDRVRTEVVRHPPGTVDWDELRERDRLRGFDLRRPGPLRVTLVDLDRADGPAATQVLVTFHHALLDAWSVMVLLDEFCRAYLEDGELPGGERRPDLRDWASWLERQDTAPARDFWSQAVPEGAPALLPGRPGPDTGESGGGRAEARLGPAEATRLHAWAAGRAVADSGALQAVWAMLLYRATGQDGPASVGFGVTVSGRGIVLDAVERLLGPLRNCLPMTVRVDPAQPLRRLLTALRDRALDMAAYEWVSTGQIHEWTGRTAGGRLLDSMVALENDPRPPRDPGPGLADAGVRFESLRASGAHTAFPVALLAHHGADSSLTLTTLHDRARISDADAALLVGHCARLLSHLPDTGETATVADVLAVLGADEPPRVAPRRLGATEDAARLRLRSIERRPVVDRSTSEL
jgi:hypothetical protein